jgi:hypothetical protein
VANSMWLPQAVVSDFGRDLGPLGPVDEPYVEEDDKSHRCHRKLRQESAECGIKLVQADAFFDIVADAPGKINVCVLDTGIEDSAAASITPKGMILANGASEGAETPL